MGRSALWGAIVAVGGVFPLAALCALTIGIPVPFAGWMHGMEWAMRSPDVVIFYGVFLGGFPVLAVLGAVTGIVLARLKRGGQGIGGQEDVQPFWLSGWTAPIVAGLVVAGAIAALTFKLVSD